MLRLMRRSIGVLACAMSLAVSYAQPPHQVRNADFPSFKLLSGATDSDGFPTSGAKLCLLKATGICFQMPSYNGYSGGSVTYEFGLDPVGERVPVTGDGSMILFSAQFSGGGSGTLDRLAILRYGADGRIVRSAAVRRSDEPERQSNLADCDGFEFSYSSDCRLRLG